MKNKVALIIFIIMILIGGICAKYGYDTLYTMNGVPASQGPPYFYGGLVAVIIGIIGTVVNLGDKK